MNLTEIKRGLKFNSTHLAILLTVIALAAGWLLKTVVTSRTEAYHRAGILASIPYKWAVKNGLEGESLVFAANPPLDMDQRYEVRLLPVVPGGKVTDAVNTRNLSQGQTLPFYKVSGQQAVRFNSQNGYQVNYAYVKTDVPGQNPVVIQGTDFYFETSTKVILATFEDSAQHFNDTLPGFYNFLATVSYQNGGQP
jgi:hypothetical protein